jgi:hypothetical protein
MAVPMARQRLGVRALLRRFERGRMLEAAYAAAIVHTLENCAAAQYSKTLARLRCHLAAMLPNEIVEWHWNKTWPTLLERSLPGGFH